MYKYKKGGFTMTEVLNFYDMEQIAKNTNDIRLQEKTNDKVNQIALFLAIKKSKDLEKFINQNIIKDKEIRNGKAVIKGTRITPIELMYFIIEEMKENKKRSFSEIQKYLYEQYPSINNENQIRAAICYVIKKEISTIRYIFEVLKND